MNKHYGEILEYIVRKKGFSITQLANGLHINRGGVYNFFKAKNLKPEIIIKIGLLMRHDFSEEFPELFTGDEFKIWHRENSQTLPTTRAGDENYWKEKYIKLLEVHNKLLSNISRTL